MFKKVVKKELNFREGMNAYNQALETSYGASWNTNEAFCRHNIIDYDNRIPSQYFAALDNRYRKMVRDIVSIRLIENKDEIEKVMYQLHVSYTKIVNIIVKTFHKSSIKKEDLKLLQYYHDFSLSIIEGLINKLLTFNLHYTICSDVIRSLSTIKFIYLSLYNVINHDDSLSITGKIMQVARASKQKRLIDRHINIEKFKHNMNLFNN
jgi:hypothetical protein